MTTSDSPSIPNTQLRLGRISYLNVLPLFDALVRDFPESPGLTYVSGHPSELNAALLQGGIDLAPASAFAYLANPGPFRLLPGLSISAADGPIQSVLFVSPVALENLPAYLEKTGNLIHLSQASASSVALLKVLWRFAWNLPEAQFSVIAPGAGAGLGRPFVEIGDAALRLYLDPPAGWHVIDLGLAWKRFTNLPFVFAVWIVRRDLSAGQAATLSRLAADLAAIKANLPRTLPRLIADHPAPPWLSKAALASYFEVVCYDFDEQRRAALNLFGDYCERLGLIENIPVLDWHPTTP
jgi:chorismate dehydratase